MNTYRPSLDDIETLVTDHPDKFTSARSSPLQARRSIQNARGQGTMVEDMTAQAQYGEYLNNGGTPIGPNGEMPAPSTAASDHQFATPCAVCAAAGGCCIKAIKFSCSHNDDRMILPLADATKDRVLAVVCDKDTVDKVTIEVDHEPNANCCMAGQKPSLTLNSNPAVTANDIKLETNLQYNFAGESLTGTDLELFAKATAVTLWSDVNTLGRDNSFDVCACGGGAQWGAVVRAFPRLEWKANAFSFEVAGEFFSDFSFVPSVTFSGSIEGKYGNSTFKVGGEAKTESDRQGHSKSIIPFLDPLLEKMASMAGDPGRAGADADFGADDYTATRSSIKVYHKFNMGNASFKLAEHPSDHSRVGIESEVKLGYAPLLGLEVKLDILDALLTAAKGSGAAAGLAAAIEKAREVMAEGIGSRDGPAFAAAHAAAVLSIDGQLGNGEVTIKHEVGGDTWEGSGAVGGSVEVKVQVIVRAEGRVYMVKGTLSGDATGSSKLSATLSTLTKSQMQTSKGAKFNAKVEWDGVGVTFKAGATASVGQWSAGGSMDSGRLSVFGPETIVDKNF